MNEVYLPDIVGGGYNEFWHTRARYRVVKGRAHPKRARRPHCGISTIC